MDEVVREGNVLRKQKTEDNLTTADIANPDLGKRGPDSVAADVDRARMHSDTADAIDRGPSAVDQSSTAAIANTNDRRSISESNDAPLFPENELKDYRARWDRAQTSFVDEPRAAVEQADSLVASVVKRIAEQFANERADLEKQWDRGEDVSTEDLRQALRRYRSFFDRLLSF